MSYTTNENSYADLEVSEIAAADQLINPLCREVFDYWAGKRDAGELQQLDPIDVPTVIPYLVIIEVGQDPHQFTFRFAGQGIVEISALDLTGKPCGEEAPITFGTCKDVVETKKPVHAAGRLVFRHPGKTYLFEETIGLPVTDRDGRVEKIWLLHGPIL